MTAMAIYFTVVRGYRIGAFMVSDKLARSQVVIVTSQFIVFALSRVYPH